MTTNPDDVTALREAAIWSLAQGLDVPPEILSRIDQATAAAAPDPDPITTRYEAFADMMSVLRHPATNEEEGTTA